MPRLVGAARLHRRDDMYQAGVFATSFQHLRHDGFLADVALGDVLDRDPRLRCQRCRPLAHAVAQRRGKLRVIEDANPDRVEKLRHSRGVAHRGKRPGHYHTVVTGQHAGDPIVIALGERPRHLALDSFGTGGRCYPLFGSGSAGLGHHRRPAIKRCRSASEKGANEFGAHDRAPGTHAVNLRTKKSILASAALAGLDFGVHAAGYCETRAFKSICTSAYLSSQTSSMRHPLTMLLTITVSPCTRGCQYVAPRP